MIQKTLSATSGYSQAKEALSPITQIRHGRRAHSPANRASAAVQEISAKPDASTVYSTDIPLLHALVNAVRVRACERERYLKEREVLTIIARSKAAMRRDVSLGLFPAQVKTGPKSSAWRESEVMGWVEATTLLSRVANPGFGMKEFVAALMTSRTPMQ